MNDFTEDELKQIDAKWKSNFDLKLDALGERVRIIERLVWIAVGGTGVLATVAMIGVTLVIEQSKQINALALLHAAAVSESKTNDYYSKARIGELQNQLEKLREKYIK